MDRTRQEFANRLLALAGAAGLWAELEAFEDSALPDAGESSSGFACGLGGHGLASRTFELVVRCETVKLEFALPALRVLSDAEVRRGDEEDVRLACKLAAAALALEPGALPGRLVARCTPGAPCAWRIVDASGALLREGEGWDGLADQVFAGFHDSDRGLEVIGV